MLGLRSGQRVHSLDQNKLFCHPNTSIQTLCFTISGKKCLHSHISPQTCPNRSSEQKITTKKLGWTSGKSGGYPLNQQLNTPNNWSQSSYNNLATNLHLLYFWNNFIILKIMRRLGLSSTYSLVVQLALVGLNDDDIVYLINHDLLMTICLPRPCILIKPNTHIWKT